MTVPILRRRTTASREKSRRAATILSAAVSRRGDPSRPEKRCVPSLRGGQLRRALPTCAECPVWFTYCARPNCTESLPSISPIFDILTVHDTGGDRAGPTEKRGGRQATERNNPWRFPSLPSPYSISLALRELSIFDLIVRGLLVSTDSRRGGFGIWDPMAMPPPYNLKYIIIGDTGEFFSVRELQKKHGELLCSTISPPLNCDVFFLLKYVSMF
ncbi:hypothetical protein BHE74_00006048 [Ensete ventricosum]|nr:hypothetical protein GW17_00034180 [Ensete ventricosum]RWW85288.1 hypothetical protein BHE74_00006048 [Ensete ventricosum]